MNNLHTVAKLRRAMGPRDKDRCYNCYKRKTKCTPAAYNFLGGEKCDQCQIGGFACSVRRKKRDHEAYESQPAWLFGGGAAVQAAAAPANTNGYGYLPAAAQTPARPPNLPQLELPAASQAGAASPITNDQYQILANVQQAPIELRPSSAAPAEALHPDPRPPDYQQLDEENTRIKDWFARLHGCDGLLFYLKSRLEALSILQPSGPGYEDKLREEKLIRDAEKLIGLEHKHVFCNLSRALSAQASNRSSSTTSSLRASFISGAWKLLASSERLVAREPTARHAAPLVAETTERLSWEEVDQYHNDGYPSLADQICRDLAIHHHAAILRNPDDQKITRIQTAYSNMSRRMLEVWQDLDPSEDLKPKDGSKDDEMGQVFSDLILITMDKLAWLVAHPHPNGGLVEAVRDFFKRTLLHLACEDPHFTSFDHFDSCSPRFVEARDKFQMTAVHVAALSGNVAAITKLRSLNADMALLDIWGRSPLMLASAKGHIHVVELLLKYTCDIDALGLNQPRALIFAIRAGMTPTVHLLLKRGASFYHKSDERNLVEEAELHGQEIIADLIRGRMSANFGGLQDPEPFLDARPLQHPSVGSNDDAPAMAGPSASLPLDARTGADVGTARTPVESATSTRPQRSPLAGAPIFMAYPTNNAPIGWNSERFPVGSQIPGGIRSVGVPLTRNNMEQVSFSRSQQRATEEGPDDVMIPHPAAPGQPPAGTDEESFGNFSLTQEEYDRLMSSFVNSEFQWPDPT